MTNSNDDRDADKQAIRQVLQDFVESMKKHDVDGVRGLYHSLAIGVGASGAGDNAWVQLVDPEKPERFVPPEGNEKWDRITFCEERVELSPTHPSIAVVSFVFQMKMAKEDLKALQDHLSELDEGERKLAEKMFTGGHARFSMFALMAKKRGQWKIVSMTFPK